MRLIGDIHGDLDYYRDTIKGHARSIQVGDFGAGFVPLQSLVELDEKEPYHKFFRGNHDHPELCKQLIRHIDSGPYQHGVFVMGGAWSIDKGMRTPGFNWWHDEQHSERELDALLEAYLQQRPHTVLTHDCPTLTSYHMFLKNSNAPIYLNSTAETLQRMFEAWQPQRWFFGHWHETKSLKINSCEFTCIGKRDYIDVDW